MIGPTVASPAVLLAAPALFLYLYDLKVADSKVSRGLRLVQSLSLQRLM